MNSTDLNVNMDYLGSTGAILNPEQKSTLQTSLCLLKKVEKFEKVYFWGKVLGVKYDYFIAQGVDSNEFGERKMFYSRDCNLWKPLPIVTESMKAQARLIKGRFWGIPSHEFEHVQIKERPGEEEEPEEETIVVKEEDRLAAVVSEIDHDVRIVPRAAYYMRPSNGKVEQNNTFEGLTISEAAKLCNYTHFRDPKENVVKEIVMEKADTDKSLDFMDPIDDDIPKGML